MFHPAEPLNPNRLLHFVERYTAEEPVTRSAALHGVIRQERGIKCVVPEMMINVALTHTSFVSTRPWRQRKLARAVLGFPDASGSILILDLDRPSRSRDIQVYPQRPNPVLVVEGDMSTGDIDDIFVRDPNSSDASLLNAVLTELAE